MLTRLAWGTLYAKIGLLALVLVTGAVLYVRLSVAPVSLHWLGTKVASALAEQIGPGWTVTLRDTALVLDDGSLGLQASGLDVRNPDGVLVVRAPYAVVTVEPIPLLKASLQPRSVELRDLQLRASINRDGSLSFLAPGEGAAEPALPARPPQAVAEEVSESAAPAEGGPQPSPISAALSSLFELIVDPTNVVGAIDRARIINARLTLIDADNRERVAFNRVEATFKHTASRTRRFDMKLNGAYGPWGISGQVYRGRGARREGTIAFSDIPVHDFMLLSGLSGLPAASDIKVSGQVEAAIAKGVVERLEARLETGGGFVEIDDKDTSPIRVDSISASASWDEARRSLALEGIRYRAGETDLTLHGELTTAPGEPGWRLALTGKDALFNGATAADPPFKVDVVEANVSSGGRNLSLDRLSLRGEKFSVLFGGSYAASDPDGLRVAIQAKEVDVRTAIRLWPEGIAAAARRFLAPNLLGGTVDRLNLTVAMTPAELARALSGGPAPDKSVKMDLTIRDAELAVTEGLPTVTRAQVQARVTGTTVSINVPSGRIQMPDGRALAVSEGSFAMTGVRDPAGPPAQIAFRVTGGADALGSLLQEPVMRSIAGLDLDPAGMTGRTDLRVGITLPLDPVPDMGDLPVMVSGTINDLTIDKLFGREKLEGANLAVGYNRGSLSVRGEGRLSGTPATIEMRQPEGGAGEIAVLLTLDEAARARRGLSAGTQLTGPVGVRLAMPVGGVKSGPRVEVDLAKAVVDNLIPGWTKAAGKPGRLSFVVGEDGGTEIRDLVIDSGTVQIRGTATFAPDGALEQADLSSVKFSPGDDMRVQVERSGGVYRVNARGNMLDARPFIKSFTAPSAPSKAPAKDQREPREVELDMAVNIVGGFHDETLTNASLKVSTRGPDLRQFQLNGRFRSAQVSGQLTRSARAPVVLLQSDDAGATLRFVDVYKRMVGGQLVFQITAGDTPQAGNVTIEDFVLRNEPALGRIIAHPPAPGAADRGNGQVPVNPNDVQFSQLKADFFRTANRLEFRDAVMWGTYLGFTVNGYVDYGRDLTDITGTFVPVYGVNNMFSKVPIFGMILGGGQNEGLFAANFRISGRASSPTLTVNPLSLVAPGFLRKFFGVAPAFNESAATAPSR